MDLTNQTSITPGTMRNAQVIRGLKAFSWLGASLPVVWLLTGFFVGWLGVNPIEKLTRVTGMTTLVLLLITLAVTPVRKLTGWNAFIRLRRLLGLFAFFYAALHFSVWMVLDLGFRLEWVWEDIAERPYITVGFTAFLLLIPLAVTSTRGWIRRLGRRWSRVHSLVYVATALGVVHYYWLVKADVRLPLVLAGIYVVLMVVRVAFWLRKRRTGSRRTDAPRAARSTA